MERLRSECMKCILDKNLEKYPENTSEKEKVTYYQKLLKILAEAKMNTSAPVIVRDITVLQEEMFGMKDEYSEVKYHFNNVMLSYEDGIRAKIMQQEDPLKLAIAYAMVGNYIDFGAMQHVDEKALAQMLDNAVNIELDKEQYDRLKEDLKTGKKLVYLTDNCGEIVMDKLLMETIKKLYPQMDITVLVRGGAVLNDATMTDACQVGLPQIVTVMGNGTQIAGTCLEEISEEAKAVFDAADLVISKGQGNFESLRKCGENIYYMFLCKCEMFARIFDVPEFTGILVNDQCLKNE